MRHLLKKFLKSSRAVTIYVTKRNYANRNILRLHERGMYVSIFPDRSPQKMLDLVNRAPQTVYAGFDPTSDSLHIGNLVVLINLMHWLRSGHKCIAVIGGATAMIGDPSGKSSERSELGKSVISRNTQLLHKNIKQIFDNQRQYFPDKDATSTERIVNNVDWFDQMKALEFVGKVGRHFRIGTMLSRQSVKDRMASEQGISFTEFTYQIFQAYDWLYLFQKYKCKFQIGGSDQMGNIVSGYELIKRTTDQDVYGMTLPLITNEEGDKFGKSAGNAIWLSEEKTTPFQFYQFFVRVKDSDVAKYLKILTFLPLQEINDIMSRHEEAPEKRLAQIKLAEQLTLLVHGEKGLNKAKVATSVLFEKDLEKLTSLESNDMAEIFQTSNTIELLFQPGLTVLQTAMKAKCFLSESDAIRVISAGGLYINYQKVRNGYEVISKTTHVLPNNLSLIRVGKKNYTIVKWME